MITKQSTFAALGVRPAGLESWNDQLTMRLDDLRPSVCQLLCAIQISLRVPQASVQHPHSKLIIAACELYPDQQHLSNMSILHKLISSTIRL